MCRVLVKMFIKAYPNEILRNDFVVSDHYLSNFRERCDLTTREAHWHRRPKDIEEMKTRIESFKQTKAQLMELFKDELWRICNADESFYGCGIAHGLTYAIKGSEGVDVHMNHNEKKGITIIATIQADGSKLPLTFVCKGLTDACHKQIYDNRVFSNELILHSETGWATKEVFQEYLRWLRKYYNDRYRENPSYIQNDRIYLFLDTYSSHRNAETKKLAKDLNITLVFIPVGCTDLCQPLDMHVFGALKNMATRTWWAYYSIDTSLECTLKLAVYILIRCWNALTPELIETAFSMHIKDLEENESIQPRISDEEASDFIERIDEVKAQFTVGELLGQNAEEEDAPDFDLLQEFSEIIERRHRRQENTQIEEIVSDDEDWDGSDDEEDLEGFTPEEEREILEYDLDPSEIESAVEPEPNYNPPSPAEVFSPLPIVDVHFEPTDQLIHCLASRSGASFMDSVEYAPRFDVLLTNQLHYSEIFNEIRRHNHYATERVNSQIIRLDDSRSALNAAMQLFLTIIILENIRIEEDNGARALELFQVGEEDSKQEDLLHILQILERMGRSTSISPGKTYNMLHFEQQGDPRLIISSFMNPHLCGIQFIDENNQAQCVNMLKLPEDGNFKEYFENKKITHVNRYLFIANDRESQEAQPDQIELLHEHSHIIFIRFAIVSLTLGRDGHASFKFYKRLDLQGEYVVIDENWCYVIPRGGAIGYQFLSLYVRGKDVEIEN